MPHFLTHRSSLSHAGGAVLLAEAGLAACSSDADVPTADPAAPSLAATTSPTAGSLAVGRPTSGPK
jgi:hypothetical protein